MKTIVPVSDEYKAAVEVARAASRKFTEAQRAYRAREIGDAEFIAARVEYDASDKAFEEAYALEESKNKEQE